MISENSQSIYISADNDWLEIVLDSSTCVAGERLSGEILLQLENNISDLSMRFSSKGTEHLKVTERSGKILEYSYSIYTLNNIIAEKVDHGKTQNIYPFTFKLPAFSPATFHFSDNDSEGNHILAQISYEIEAVLYSGSQEILKCTKRFFALNRNTRMILSGENSDDSALICCCCFPRGLSTISFGYLDSIHCTCGNIKRYKVCIKSPLNASLRGLKGQIIYQLLIQIPMGRSYIVTKTISKSVPDLSSIIRENQDLQALNLEFEADLEHLNFGENPCSNECNLFGSEYKLQFFASYGVGCRNKISSCEMLIHVNPLTIQKETPSIPDRWEPKEHLISNLIVEVNDSILSSNEDYRLY